MGSSHESIRVVKTKGLEEQMEMLGSKVEQVWRGGWETTKFNFQFQLIFHFQG